MSRSRGPIRWLHRLGIRRVPAGASVDWEIEHHLAELADRLMDEGWSEADALHEAERRFGDRHRYARPMRRMARTGVVRSSAGTLVDLTRQTLGGVVRMARRFPAFTAGVVLTMGLGVGANATMFGIIDRLLLSAPDHIVEPDQVKRVLVRRPGPAGQMTSQSALAYPDYVDLKVHGGMSVAAYANEGTIRTGAGESETVADIVLASAEFFPLLGVRPRLGRFFSAEEAESGAPLTAVISEEYWRRAYGADPEILGRTIELRNVTVPIIGVAPAGFTGIDLDGVDVWFPLEASEGVVGADCGLDYRNCYWMFAVARLNEGESLERAEVEATGLHRNGRREEIEVRGYPASAEIVLAPLIAAAGPDPSGESRVATWLAGVSLLVVLIACANVANLLLSRGSRLRREMAIRAALGAGRSRLIGQATVETVALALAGGALAIVIARWGGAVVRRTLLPGVYFPNAAIGTRVILFTLAVSLLAGLLAGVWPAVRSSRAGVADDLSDTGRGNSEARSSVRSFLTVSQTAVSVVLLVGAGLFVRSLNELRGLDLGLDLDQVLLANFEFEDPMDTEVVSAAFDEAARRAAPLPMIESIATTATPFGMGMAVSLRIPSVDSLPRLPGGGPYVQGVDADYFRTAGLSIVSGRAIEASDVAGSPLIAVVSQTMARMLWPDEEPLGQCLLVGSGAAEAGCTTVVGVVEDAARFGYQDEPFMSYYLSLDQSEGVQGTLLSTPQGMMLRVRGNPREAASAVSEALRDVSPDIEGIRVSSLRDRLDPQARSWRLGATMFTVFGLLALVVAGIGLYSVLAFSVAQRTREIGIRAALGAEQLQLLGRVVLAGGGLALSGVLVGLLIAFVGAPFAADLLFQVSPRDPLVLGSVAGILLAVAVLASLIPGLRAAQTDPMVALRAD